MLLRLTARKAVGAEFPIVIQPSQPAALGRSREADHSLPDDLYMSGKHFEIRFEPPHWLAKDLGSSNGLLLNGERITESAVKPGDVLRAGSTEFRVSFVDDVPKPPPLLAIEALQAEPEPAFCVIDAAASPDLYRLALENPGQSVSLFDGTPLEKNSAHGPHVISFGDDATLLASFVYGGWDANASIYLTSGEEFLNLAGFLKSLLLAKTEDGHRLLFRYYDPRVLRAFLPTCTPGEVAEFFGPVAAWFAGENVMRWRKYSRDPAGLVDELLDFGAGPAQPAEDAGEDTQ